MAATVVLLAYALYPVRSGPPPRPRGPAPLPPVFDGQAGPPHLPPRLTEDEVARQSQLAGAWMQIRSRLAESGDPAASRWSEQLGALIVDLRPQLNDVPTTDPLPVERRLLSELAAQPDWLAIEGVRVQVSRIETLLNQ